MDETAAPPTPVPKPPSFFQKTDWQAFGLAALVIFIVYWFSLAPETGLADTGMYATTAMYPGPSTMPGHPIWVIYGWIFIKLIPFSNIAWRLGVSSTVAGSVTCGLLALLMSRVGLSAVENLRGFKNFSHAEQKSLRLVSGVVAGLGFGFDVSFWPKVVVVDPWPFSLLLYTLSLTFLTRWFFRPAQKLPLYGACFTSALTLVECDFLSTAVLALLFVLIFGERKLSRDTILLIGILAWSFLGLAQVNEPLAWALLPVYSAPIQAVAISASVIGVVMCRITRGCFTQWKALFICAAMLGIGLCTSLLLVVFSMSDPSVNAGYPRTVEGYLHNWSRGEYGTMGIINYYYDGFFDEWYMYFKLAAENWGIFYLISAIVPFALLMKIPRQPRLWTIGISGAWLFTCLIMLGNFPIRPYTNPDFAKSAPYFAVTHLLLALLGGLGLILIGTYLGRRSVPPVETVPVSSTLAATPPF